jgi:hypothetical protein
MDKMRSALLDEENCGMLAIATDGSSKRKTRE